ncbi:MAG: hypothetical protein GC168_12190 [Candidatus Hydrogenedens sp.]|nr:hypothetical protein [Candidatus Hydrogenedens sp.]
MTHPAELLGAPARRRLYWFLFVATFAWIGVMQYLAKDFASIAGPKGETYDIVAFELAHTSERAAAILAVWGDSGTAAALVQTYADYVFLILYSSLIAMGILAVVSGLPEKSGWLRTGRTLAWLQWVAALCDGIENAAMIVSMKSGPVVPLPQVAYYFAAVKFGIIIAGLLFLLIALPVQYRDRTASN